MATQNDREIVDRIIDQHLDTHPNDRYGYHTDHIFRQGVDLTRQVLYGVCAAAGHFGAGIDYDRTVYMLRTVVEEFVNYATCQATAEVADRG